MKLFKFMLLTAGLLISFQSTAMAENASCDEAKAFSDKAVAYYKEHGAEKAFAEFMDKESVWFDRNLYVFAFGKDATYHVHGAKPVMVGKNAIDLKDATGKLFIKEIVETEGSAWVEYKYPDAADNNKVKDKKSWVTSVDDYIIGTGCYVQ